MTGWRLDEFDALVEEVRPALAAAEVKRLSRPDRQRGMGGGWAAVVSERDQVLLTVINWRQYARQAVLGYLFGLSQPSVSRILERVVPWLEREGRDRMRMPDPGRKRRRHLDEWLQDRPEWMVLIDSVEQTVQRPKDAADRAAWYRGQNKPHPIQRQTAGDAHTGQLVDVPHSVPGPKPDSKLLEQSKVLDTLPDNVGGLGECG